MTQHDRGGTSEEQLVQPLAEINAEFAQIEQAEQQIADHRRSPWRGWDALVADQLRLGELPEHAQQVAAAGFEDLPATTTTNWPSCFTTLTASRGTSCVVGEGERHARAL